MAMTKVKREKGSDKSLEEIQQWLIQNFKTKGIWMPETDYHRGKKIVEQTEG